MKKSIYFIDTRDGFQTVMQDLKTNYVELCAANPQAAKGVSINAGRIIAAALKVAADANVKKLADMIDPDLIPGSGFQDKVKNKDAVFKAVHLPLRMIDYVKSGAAHLNIYVLGPKEDSARELTGNNDIEYRITPRQYMHLAVIYLSTLSNDGKLLSLISSNSLYPFVMPGPVKRTKF